MLQRALELLYPPQCLTCGALVETPFGLCGSCWRDTPFIGSPACDLCGVPLPGEDAPPGARCDDCMTLARPWAQGRAAVLYRGNARKLVLSLKHGDREDLAPPAAKWMVRAGAPLTRPGTLIAPVPLHWMRMMQRRYNQAALLAQGVGAGFGLPVCPDLLQRPRRTRRLDGHTRDERFDMVRDALRVTPRHKGRVSGRPVLIVDDVMTSGATLAAASDACLRAGASEVRILVLARVAKDA